MTMRSKGKTSASTGVAADKLTGRHLAHLGKARTSKETVLRTLPKFTSEGIIFVSFRHKGKESRATDLDIINAIQAGLPATVMLETAKSLQLPTTTIESIISRRTLERRLKAHQLLSVEESDKLVRLIQTISRAVEVFGDKGTALQWMKEPNRAMGGRTPFSLVNTSPGVELIKDILGRIEHGVYS